MQQVIIHTDGACSGNPGPGGWGAILTCQTPPLRKEINGGDPHTTNNRMELQAVIEALRMLKHPCDVRIVTDSSYIVNAFNKGWLTSWQAKGWKTSSKQPVKNEDQWKEILQLVEGHSVTWSWIKGHNGHPENERADELAVAARDQASRSPMGT